MPLIVKFALVVLVSTQIANIATTVYLHRGLAHRAVKFNPFLEGILRFFVWLTTTVVRQEWVAVHRKHHAFSDKEGDPHSPVMKGFWNIQLWNYFYYRAETQKEEVVSTYSKDIASDWFDRLSHKSWIPMLLLAGIMSLILGPIWGPIAAICHFGVYVVLSATVNGACHTYGYKHHDNMATNIWTVGLLTAGEGFHNNHHEKPANAKLGYRWYEFDIGWVTISVFSLLHLAKVRS